MKASYPRHVAVHRFRVCWSQAGRVVGGLASPALQHRLERKNHRVNYGLCHHHLKFANTLIKRFLIKQYDANISRRTECSMVKFM